MTSIDTGQVIAGHYRVLDRIGSGGMGVVWRARDERLQRVVAVKQVMLQPGLSAAETENARQRTLREARIAARLQHPNAILVFDVAEHDGQPCLVLEYLEGRSLAAVLAERGALPPVEVAGIGGQVASALAAAHVAGIVHRDVKPGNVLLDAAGTAKITDFGISRAAGDVTVTQTGMVAGTPAFLAPEVARGQAPTAASDVFSLGAMLYTAVEGHSPYGSTQNQLAVLHAAAAGNLGQPRQAGPLAPVLQDLLREDPAHRPGMVEAATVLASVARGGGRVGPALLSRPAGTSYRRPAAPTPTLPPSTGDNGTIGSTAAGGVAAPVRPAPARPGTRRPAAPASGRHRNAVVVVAILVLVALGGFGVLSLFGGGGGQQDAPRAGGERPAVVAPAPVPEPAEPEPEPEPPAVPDVTEGDPIEYSPAGELVIDYYNSLDDPDSAYAMLSPRSQELFGGPEGFRAHWAQFEQVSARNANGVTTNDDGSVTVPVDVSYDGGTEQREVRVTRLDGQLLIDSEAR